LSTATTSSDRYQLSISTTWKGLSSLDRLLDQLDGPLRLGLKLLMAGLKLRVLQQKGIHLFMKPRAALSCWWGWPAPENAF
jgi:hypothetical protein